MPVSSLKNTPFPRFVCAQTVNSMAYNMLTVALGWQVYDLTHSALSLGFVGLAQFLPQFGLALVAGQAADRFDRRRLILWCQCVLGAAALLLALGSFRHGLAEPAILALAAVMGGTRAFVQPTMSAYLPSLMPMELLPRALALSGAFRQFGVIVGPAVGGALYALGPETAYAACALCAFVSIAALAGIPVETRRPAREKPSLRFILGGAAFIRANPQILGAISLDLFSMLLGGATALLPVYARDILRTGPFGLGLLRAAPAVGALATSLFLARHALAHRVGRKMFGAVAAFGLSTIVFGLSTNFVASLAALVVLGASDMVSVVVRAALVQLETPDVMRGRVSAVNSVFIGTSHQLGEFESGVTASWFGAVPAVVIGGACTLVVVALWMRLFPALRDRDALV